MLTYYIPALFVSFGGLGVGMLLSFFAREEIMPGTEYLQLLEKALLVMMVMVVTYALNIPLIFRLGIYAAFIMLISIIHIRSALYYPLLAIPFFYAQNNPEQFLLIASLVFLIGFPAGSLAIKKYEVQETALVILKHSTFVATGLALLLAK